MTIIDWVILGIIGVSGLISLVRGFVKEALSLVSWLIAFLVARYFSGNLATLLQDSIATNSVRWMVAFAILFVATLVVLAMVNFLIAQLVKATGLSGTDRLFGMVFGVLRGVIVVVALVYGAQLTGIPQQDAWWQESTIIPYLETLADWARKTLPAAVGQVMGA
ncbi:MAG: colicin V production CvpA [Thalassolituus sp.]|mgnify:CR=1 FL=1|jgi:membrane protein required for colicin V production|uniref:CvpA family protein n=1 Tax=Thalassolituus maritimus TaxID=484498 RepID=A0ABP9ZYX7_9GAMM|nr:CvpA family protein [Pseudomonadota bacterium]MEC8102545.1 CvpA family protein [Pseudomonadota bacterium]MEC8524688.1 CvpA family protein [Pseudomonadota bacterium]TNC85899.1 MAG: colicin V production CvpA [Thalassolituus sp.]|tara:strand:+ start:201 stop:692 length:492 start_codon:yes stop_codon:yes gene_type:complete